MKNETSVLTINRRLPVLTAAPGVQRAKYFPPLSRVGRGIDVNGMKSMKNRARRSRTELNVSLQDPQVGLYSSTAYVEMLKKHGMVQSMSRRGNCYDNAVAESFFSSLKNELVNHCSFKTREEARTAVFEYIEVFYNRQHRHQSLDYFSPVDYERSMAVA